MSFPSGVGCRPRTFTRIASTMTKPLPFDTSEMELTLWRLYRDFFDKAERKRRWRVRDDIPWDQTNPNLNPAVADVVESFCAVELYLPDYLGKILPMVRPSKSRTWFYANWGYEESKHSLALQDWLLRSGMRSEEQIADLEKMVFEREWNLPTDSVIGMMVYAMVQELATWLNYRNLRLRVIELGGDPALEKLLQFIQVDERAHHAFFRDCTALFLKEARDEVIEEMRGVMNEFAMPAIDELAEGRQRKKRIQELNVFDADMYFRDVYLPMIKDLGVEWNEMRPRRQKKKTLPAE